MVEGSIARRYARALLELGRDDGQIDRLGADLERFAGFLASGPAEVTNVMSNPVFTNAERRAVLDRLLPAIALHPNVVSFLRLLLDKDRFGALADIVREYRALADTEAGRVRATVTAAVELPADTRAAVASALAQATGKQVVLDTRIDPALLGGIVAQVGGRVYDASLRTRLERLQLNLVNPSQA